MPADRRAVVRDLFGEPTKQADTRIAAKAQQSESTLLGRYAEFMVCAYLSRLGHTVHHVDAAGFDLILEYENASYRIDVKSTSHTYIGPRKEMAFWNVHKNYRIELGTEHGTEQGKRRNRRMLLPDDCDMLALFHNSFSTVVYYPVTKPLKQVRLPLSQVRNTDYGEASLKAAVIAKSRSGVAWR